MSKLIYTCLTSFINVYTGTIRDWHVGLRGSLINGNFMFKLNYIEIYGVLISKVRGFLLDDGVWLVWHESSDYQICLRNIFELRMLRSESERGLFRACAI